MFRGYYVRLSMAGDTSKSTAYPRIKYSQNGDRCEFFPFAPSFLGIRRGFGKGRLMAIDSSPIRDKGLSISIFPQLRFR